jgi:4-aminobutyrate aminotransferase
MNAPEIKVTPPGPAARAVLEKVRRLESRSTATFGMSPEPAVLERGRGATIEDADGNVFLDFVAGFGVLNTGHGHPAVIEAMKAQMDKLVHVMGAANPTRTALMEALVEVTPGDGGKRILFAAGGGEAVDMALRLVREVSGNYEVLAFYGAYHGRGQGAMSLMGRGAGRKGIRPMLAGATHVPYPYCYRCPFGKSYPDCGLACARFVEDKIKGQSTGLAEPAAIFIEPVQGNGGMIPAPVEFLLELRRICDETGVLLVADEIMSGFGRTGSFFAIEKSAVTPDVLILGKALGAGLPLSAVVARSHLVEEQKPNRDSSTLAGNPVAAAGALATIAVIHEQGLMKNAAETGAYFLEGLKALAERFPVIGDVRGVGLMLGFELVADRETKEPLAGSTRRITQLCNADGLMLYPAGGHHGNVVGFLPPLIIDRTDVDAALEIVEGALARYEAERQGAAA